MDAGLCQRQHQAGPGRPAATGQGGHACWVAQLFPKDKLEASADIDLSHTCPPNDEVFAGCFGTVSVIAAKEFGLDRP